MKLSVCLIPLSLAAAMLWMALPTTTHGSMDIALRVPIKQDCVSFAAGAPGRNGACSGPAAGVTCVTAAGLVGLTPYTGKGNFRELTYWDCAVTKANESCWAGWGWNVDCLTFDYFNGVVVGPLGTVTATCAPGTWVGSGANQFNQCW